jgi:hypothetical protein
MPEVYEFLEAERIKYAIRLPVNQVLQDRIGYLLKRPVGRPPSEVRRFHANFTYQAGSWNKPRRVIAKVEGSCASFARAGASCWRRSSAQRSSPCRLNRTPLNQQAA